MQVKIYALCDPRDSSIRYIGRTKKAVLEHRLLEHISKSKYYTRYYLGKRVPHRVNWINSLLSVGLEPKIRLLCNIEGWKDSHIFERQLIDKYKEKKRLVNTEDRGCGSQNHHVSEETKIQIRETLLRKYASGEVVSKSYKETHVYDISGNYIQSFSSRKEAAIFCDTTEKQICKCFTTGKWARKKVNGFRFSNEKLEKLPPI